MLVGMTMLAVPGVRAQQEAEPAAYNVFELQADAVQEVANDLLQAVMFVEANDADPVKLAATLNRALTEALREAKAHAPVSARSGGYQTYPVYDRSQRLTGWRGRAEIRLESRDFEAASALIGRLQSKLQLGSLSFTVSPEARRSVHDRLITEAIAAFRARAEIVRSAVGGTRYRIRRVALHTGDAFPPPRPVAFRTMAAAEAAPPPPTEGGTSRVSVVASGSIEVE